ncbi:hypothetical protein HK102_010334 [Quaeritorhiza haematococci]|nr:hypothetical protein HK102_010334 [Quaeritorhiza haematococci]
MAERDQLAERAGLESPHVEVAAPGGPPRQQRSRQAGRLPDAQPGEARRDGPGDRPAAAVAVTLKHLTPGGVDAQVRVESLAAAGDPAGKVRVRRRRRSFAPPPLRLDGGEQLGRVDEAGSETAGDQRGERSEAGQEPTRLRTRAQDVAGTEDGDPRPRHDRTNPLQGEPLGVLGLGVIEMDSEAGDDADEPDGMSLKGPQQVVELS